MISDHIFKIKQRIAGACAKIGRDPRQITLVAISKGRTAREIEEAIEAGISDIGENRVQEAELKYRKLITSEPANPRTIKWHMVGHLQTNKAKEAVKIFDLIHSLDSIRLAREIDRQAARINKVQSVLIEIKTSPEATKSGIASGEAVGLIKEIASLKNISLKGLMTIAPLVNDPEKARPYFRELRELRDSINAISNMQYAICELSMGMTDDFEIAIEEGANMLRIGRAVFEG